MCEGTQPFPDPETGSRLYSRLSSEDATAQADFADAYMGPLASWLAGANPAVDEHLCLEAAGTALLGVIKNPPSYDPERSELGAYLRMSAQADLRNLLAREARHHRNRCEWGSVELSPDPGKYLGREDDPSLPLRVAEEAAASGAVPASVREGLTEGELRVLELMRAGERKTAAFAEALGLADQPREGQAREVKRVKDKLSKRLQRAEGEYA